MKKTVKIVVLFILALSLGFGLGNLIDFEKEENEIHTQKIAIVNEDEGVTYNDEDISYSNELLKVTSDDVMITSRNNAIEGLKNGQYAAYMIVPKEFSKNIVSINKNPTKTDLDYFVNKELNQEDYRKTLMNIHSLEKGLNDNIGFMYIESISNSFVEGQRKAKNVIENDKSIISALNSVSPLDLIETLHITELPPIDNSIVPLNLEATYIERTNHINKLDNQYKENLKESEEELQLVKSDLDSFEMEFPELSNKLSKISFIQTIDKSEKNYNNTHLFNEVDDTEKTNSKKLKKIKDTVNNTRKKELNYNKELVDHISELEDKAEEYKAELISFKEGLTVLNHDTIDAEEFKELLETYIEIENNYDRINEVIENHNGDVSNLIEERNELMAQTVLGVGLLKDVVNHENSDKTIDEILAEMDYLDLKDYAEILYGEIVSKTLVIDKPQELKKIDDETIDYSKAINAEAIFNNIMDNYVKMNEIKDDLDAMINGYEVNDLNNEKLDDLEEEINELLNNIESTDLEYLSKSKLENRVKDDLNDLNIQQQEAINEVNKTYGKKMKTLKENRINVEKYNPLEYIEIFKVESIIRDIENNGISAERDLEAKNKEYDLLNTTVYKDATEHVTTVLKDVSEADTLSKEKVTHGLKDAIVNANNNSSANQNELTDFINELPYLKNDNTTIRVEDFITNPTNIELKTEVELTEEKNVHLPVIISFSVSAVAAISLLGMKFLSSDKKTEIKRDKEIV